jgi:hypothetical protein
MRMKEGREGGKERKRKREGKKSVKFKELSVINSKNQTKPSKVSRKQARSEI